MRKEKIFFIFQIVLLFFFQFSGFQLKSHISVQAFAIQDDVRVVEYTGEVSGDWSGYDVTGVGDVNNDGYNDFAISAPFNDEGGDNAGQIYLILGRKTELWNADPPLSVADASFIGESIGDMSGFEISGVGDVNHDDYDDFAISAPFNDEGGENAGQVYLILGRTTGDWSMDMDLSAADASFQGENPIDTVYGISGVGNINNDDYDDFLISATGNDKGGDNAGQVYLILGRSTGDWSMDMDLSSADASFIGENPGDELGMSLSIAGDLNKDNYDDILIGTSINSEGGNLAGQTYVFLGRVTGDWSMDMVLSSADASFIGENPGDESGKSVSGAGDVNNDGFDDFIIGAIANDEVGNSAGQVYLILGQPTGEWSMDTYLSAADASFLGEASEDQAGWSIAGVGNTNGDSFDDFIICANRNDKGGNEAGRAYLFLGQPTERWIMDIPLSEANATFTGESPNDLFGSSVSGVGDVNKDGLNDFIIGARWNDDSGDNAGKSYMVLYPFPVIVLIRSTSLSIIPALLGIGTFSFVLLLLKEFRTKKEQ